MSQQPEENSSAAVSFLEIRTLLEQAKALSQSNPNEATVLAMRVLEAAQQAGYPGTATRARQTLAALYEQQGDLKSAVHHLKLAQTPLPIESSATPTSSPQHLENEHLQAEIDHLKAESARLQQDIRFYQVLKQAIETVEVGVTITDHEGHIIYTNPADAHMHVLHHRRVDRSVRQYFR